MPDKSSGVSPSRANRTRVCFSVNPQSTNRRTPLNDTTVPLPRLPLPSDATEAPESDANGMGSWFAAVMSRTRES